MYMFVMDQQLQKFRNSTDVVVRPAGVKLYFPELRRMNATTMIKS